MKSSDITNIQAEAARGRGLWVGLMIDTATFGPGWMSHPLSGMLPDHAHMTVAHVGKGVSPEIVAQTLAAADAVFEDSSIFSRGQTPIDVEITGYGWFWRNRENHPVALLNGAILGVLRHRLISRLPSYSDRYGFIPHVSLKSGIAIASLGIARSIRARFPTIHVVCGDVSVAAQ